MYIYPRLSSSRGAHYKRGLTHRASGASESRAAQINMREGPEFLTRLHSDPLSLLSIFIYLVPSPLFFLFGALFTIGYLYICIYMYLYIHVCILYISMYGYIDTYIRPRGRLLSRAPCALARQYTIRLLLSLRRLCHPHYPPVRYLAPLPASSSFTSSLPSFSDYFSSFIAAP